MKNFNFIINRICANTPPCRFRGASRFVWTLVLMLTMGVGQMWGANIKDELTRALTGVTNGSTSYTGWSGKTSNSDAVYAGSSAGGSDAIQIRSKNSNSGIISTTSGGKVKTITITMAQAANAVDVYGSNTAYTNVTDLFNTTKRGTKLGTLTNTGTINVTGDYAYVGICSSNGAAYLTKVEITWSTGSSCSNTITISKGTPTNGSFSLPHPFGAFCLEKFRP